MNIYKILRRQKEIRLAEIKKDKNKGIPVRINPDSLVAKEIEYQTCLLKEIQEEMHHDLTEIKKYYKQNFSDIDVIPYLECIKNNETLFNAEIFLDRILSVELYRMINILYLDCKNEFGFFDKNTFEKMSKNLDKKISTRYDELVNIYRKL